MKPFAVRLAAGAVTILLGAFAVAQAQKDRQNNTDESWTATVPPSLGQTPAPIGDLSSPSWIEQPGPSSALSTAAASLTSAPSVQLVQHTEPSGSEGSTQAANGGSAMTLPAFNPNLPNESSGNEESGAIESSASLAPSWALPGQDSAPAAAAPSLSMTLPASVNGSDPAAANEMAEMRLAQPPADNLLGGSQEGAGTPLPTDPSLAANATLEADSYDAGNYEAGNYDAGNLQSGGYDAGGNNAAVNEQFPNTLRGGPGSDNPMRDSAESNQAAQQSGLSISPEYAAGAPAFNPLAADNRVNDASGPQRFDPNSNSAASGLGQPITADPNSQGQQSFAESQRSFDTPPSLAASPDPLPRSAANNQSDPRLDPRYAAPQTQAPMQYGDYTAAPVAAAPQQYDEYANTPPPRIASLPNAMGSVQPGYPSATLEQANGAAQLNTSPTITNASPGDRRLEGVQSPSIVIQKRAPSEVKVGKPASFVIHVQNVGSVEALDVRVHDQIPRGMRLIDASPTPVLQGDRLLWQLGAMPAGDERTVTMQLIPEQEGELGSVARVTFEAAASVRTISTRPELQIVQKAPEQVLIGQQLEIELEVSNPGSGAATGVILQEDVPDGLEHPKGRQLDNLIGTLAPGEVRRQVLRLRAVAPGVIQNQIRLTGDDGLTAEHLVAVEVIAPQLQAQLTGPSKRYLERPATYQLEIANVGTADATNVEISVKLDRGFTFVSTDYEGQYDPSQHTVFWSLAQLPVGGSGTVPLTLLPVEVGEQAINLDVRADLGVVAKSERTILVDAFAELSFQITNPGGPIEVGSETMYEIRVQNSGSRKDTNIQVQLQLPRGLELISADGDAGTDGRGLVAFQPRGELAAGSEMTYKLRVRGVLPGTHLVKATVISDQATQPVTKEESTLVYTDE